MVSSEELVMDGDFDDEFDAERFSKTMKMCYEYFIKTRDQILPFNYEETVLFAKIYAYSQIPIGNDDDELAVSTAVAEEIACFFLHPDWYTLEDDTITRTYIVDDEELVARYDFNAGNIDDYMEFWDNGGFEADIWNMRE